MSYVALYRKFRPQTFSQVKGQDHVVRTLENQVKNNRIGHAYLFTGTRGTGKTSVAKILAKTVNCLNPVNGEPCNECENCKSVQAGNFMDVVEIDAASNTGVDDIRRVIEEIQYTPAKGKYKVYIIDEVHMLSGNAANAFLKTLEEPPEYVIFILATTEPHKLPITVLSRCQRYDFKRISVDTITENLEYLLNNEKVEYEEKAVRYIARAADGSMRDSISLLDKCIAFNLGNKLTYDNVIETLGVVDVEILSRLFRGIVSGDIKEALAAIEGVIDDGKDITQFATDFVTYLRNLLFINVSGGINGTIMGVQAENLQIVEADAKLTDSEVLLRYIRILSDLIESLRYSMSKQILLEVAVIKLARPQMETDNSSVLDRIRVLEEKVENIAKNPAPRDYDFDPYLASSAVFEPEYTQDSYEEPSYTEPSYEEPSFSAVTFEAPKASVAEPPRQEESKVAESGDTAAVCSRWKEVVAACQNGRLKVALNKAAVGSEEGFLVVYAASGMAYAQLKEEEAVGYIKKLILEVTGISIDVRVKGASAKPEIENQADLESLLGNINITIGTEDM